MELLKDGWIQLFWGPWGSLIVLAAKPHQESCCDISEFIWRMCVSYRKLNAITKPFQFPISRCDISITVIGNGSVNIFIVVLDNRQGYHQVAVRPADQEKLAFFAPDENKYCFQVMPLGPCNAPAFYTAMMKDFNTEWLNLFIETVQKLPSYDKAIFDRWSHSTIDLHLIMKCGLNLYVKSSNVSSANLYHS